MANKSDYLEKSKSYKGFHYSELDKNEIEYLHNRTLEMFKQVKEIFDNNGIKYMICGGTLLGAIGSGKGHFIPWDDDFDMCIFEEDYDKAINLLINNLKEDTVLQYEKSDSNYYIGWIKVRDRRSHVYPDEPKFKENGVWIDIYKLVRCEKRNVEYLITQELKNYLNRRFAIGGITREEYEKREKNWNLKERLEIAEKKSSEIKNDEKVYIIWSASKVVLNEEWILPLRKTIFENIEVTTFNKAEEYLIQHYGKNYNQLPSDDLRRVGINKVEIIEINKD